VIGLFKTELTKPGGPWRTAEQVELATLEWVWWWNNQRLHGELGYRTPAETENAYYADPQSARLGSRQPRKNLGTQTQGDSIPPVRFWRRVVSTRLKVSVKLPYRRDPR